MFRVLGVQGPGLPTLDKDPNRHAILGRQSRRLVGEAHVRVSSRYPAQWLCAACSQKCAGTPAVGHEGGRSTCSGRLYCLEAYRAQNLKLTKP